jgi:hypothetical protein
MPPPRAQAKGGALFAEMGANFTLTSVQIVDCIAASANRRHEVNGGALFVGMYVTLVMTDVQIINCVASAQGPVSAAPGHRTASRRMLDMRHCSASAV